MSNADIIRAWKDTKYRASLSHDERALLPPHPAGITELEDDAYLDGVVGGQRPYSSDFPGCGSMETACHHCTCVC